MPIAQVRQELLPIIRIQGYHYSVYSTENGSERLQSVPVAATDQSFLDRPAKETDSSKDAWYHEENNHANKLVVERKILS
jgi:hypothetical protein